jgi:uncharacterized RmlC-like cupin family protein
MAGEKYGKYIKELSFRNDGPGFYRQVTRLSGAPFGLDFHVEYGAYWAPGYMGDKPYRPHKHDYNQVMLWLGADTGDMGELGAEVELCLGEEGEKHMITSTTAVAVPAGMPHFPANITRMDRRFIFMTVSCAPECKEIPLPAGRKRAASQPVTIFNAKYRDNIINIAFTRKGAWSYGPKNPDDSGGSLAFIRGRDPKFDFLIMCESLKKAPYRFGPEPDKPHAHPMPEILFFIGTDLNDLTKLGGEAEICLGREMERHVITAPTAVVIPGKLAHNPLVITRVDRPFILCDVRPFGTDMPAIGRM